MDGSSQKVSIAKGRTLKRRMCLHGIVLPCTGNEKYPSETWYELILVWCAIQANISSFSSGLVSLPSTMLIWSCCLLNWANKLGCLHGSVFTVLAVHWICFTVIGDLTDRFCFGHCYFFNIENWHWFRELWIIRSNLNVFQGFCVWDSSAILSDNDFIDHVWFAILLLVIIT